MTHAELKKIGRRLYGNDWQSPMARALKIHRSTVWRWLTKKFPVPDDMAAKIRKLK